MQGSRTQWARWLPLAALAWLAGAPAQAVESLCAPDEPIVFSCHIGKKTLSLCRPSTARQELRYRFGTPGKLELAYPQPGARQAGPAFERSTLPAYGGGVTAVHFRRGEYEYSIYSKAGRASDAERTPEVEDGITVSRNGKPLRTMVCDDGGEGFRESLDWLPKVSPTPVTQR